MKRTKTMRPKDFIIDNKHRLSVGDEGQKIAYLVIKENLYGHDSYYWIEGIRNLRKLEKWIGDALKYSRATE